MPLDPPIPVALTKNTFVLNFPYELQFTIPLNIGAAHGDQIALYINDDQMLGQPAYTAVRLDPTSVSIITTMKQAFQPGPNTVVYRITNAAGQTSPTLVSASASIIEELPPPPPLPYPPLTAQIAFISREFQPRKWSTSDNGYRTEFLADAYNNATHSVNGTTYPMSFESIPDAELIIEAIAPTDIYRVDDYNIIITHHSNRAVFNLTQKNAAKGCALMAQNFDRIYDVPYV